MMQSDQAQTLIKKLGAAFPTTPLGAETVVLWASVLAKLPFGSGVAAVDSVIGSCKRFPTIAEFNEALGTIREHSRTALPAPKPQPLTDAEREAARARVAALHERIGEHRERFTMPPTTMVNKPKPRPRRYVVDPETGHAEVIR